MRLAVLEHDLDVYYWEASERTIGQRLLDAIVDRLDVLLWNTSTGDGVFEAVAAAGATWLHRAADLCELTGTTRLLFVGVLVAVERLGDGLAVGNLWLTDGCVNLELTLHTIDEDFEVKLAHTRDDGLAGLLVGLDLEGRVLFAERHERLAELVLGFFVLRFNRNVNHGIREGELFEHDRVLWIGERIAGASSLETNTCSDVAGLDDVAILLVVCVHLQETTDALFVLGAVVENRAALFQAARVHTEVGELADEGVGHDLERQCGERRLVVDVTGLGFARAWVRSFNWRKIDRCWHVVNHRVEQWLHALVLERGAVEDRNDLARKRALADDLLEIFDADVLVAEVALHEVFIDERQGVHQVGAILLGLGHHVLGNVFFGEGRAEIFLVDVRWPHEGLHLDEVDHSGVFALGTDRKLQNSNVFGETLLDGLEHEVEVGARAVHLVDEAHARHVVLVGLTPNGFGLWLYASNTVEHGNCTIENTQRALNLDREVDVARGIDDVDLVVVPSTGGSSRGDRDATLLLLLHPVHGGAAVVDLTDLVVHAGVIEDAFGRRRLARVDVGHDPNVSGFFEWHSLCHGVRSSGVLRFGFAA